MPPAVWRLIPDSWRFESRLRDWIRDATNPPVMGVEYKSYPGPTGEGFVICFIPKSDHKPHRVEWASQQYYYRAGDDFLLAQPGLLRTLFYPEFNPSLRVEASLLYQLQPKEVAEAYAREPEPEMLTHLLNTPPKVSSGCQDTECGHGDGEEYLYRCASFEVGPALLAARE